MNSTVEAWSGELAGVRVTTGAGSLEQLGKEVSALGATHALLITDPGLVRAGHAERAHEAIRSAGLGASTFTEVHENPSTEDVTRGVEAARSSGADALVALGGGSAMDCTKGTNFVLTNGGEMSDYWGYGKASLEMLPMVAVPTTCGTGSEAQSYALISQAGSRRKMACGDPKALFRAVVLDPELTISAPKWVRSVSGFDAVAHAVESLVTTRATEVSKALSERAYELLDGAFEQVLGDKPRIEPLGRMQLGAHLAGAAIEKSMLGAAHAAANPLTARCRITHGEAVALMLPHVVRFNSEAAEEAYARLLPGGSRALARRLETLRHRGGLAKCLQDLGVARDTLGSLARLAIEEWTGSFNPRPVTERDFIKLYEQAYA
ncbi:MAG: iron-containing alcohol dehydrogenase [bacterium]|nr:iron-containing alcohol dehydrogenase [bacterium]